MKLHPRHVPYTKARLALLNFLITLVDDHGLTIAERRTLVADWLQSDLELDVRYERSQEPESPT